MYVLSYELNIAPSTPVPRPKIEQQTDQHTVSLSPKRMQHFVFTFKNIKQVRTCSIFSTFT